MRYIYIFRLPTGDDVQSINFYENGEHICFEKGQFALSETHKDAAIVTSGLIPKATVSTLHLKYNDVPLSLFDFDAFDNWVRNDGEMPEYLDLETGKPHVKESDGENKDV